MCFHHKGLHRIAKVWIGPTVIDESHKVHLLDVIEFLDGTGPQPARKQRLLRTILEHRRNGPVELGLRWDHRFIELSRRPGARDGNMYLLLEDGKERGASPQLAFGHFHHFRCYRCVFLLHTQPSPQHGRLKIIRQVVLMLLWPWSCHQNAVGGMEQSVGQRTDRRRLLAHLLSLDALGNQDGVELNVLDAHGHLEVRHDHPV